MIILGDYAVGKTSLICRYIDGKFQQQDSVSTVTERETDRQTETLTYRGGGGGESGRERKAEGEMLTIICFD